MIKIAITTHSKIDDGMSIHLKSIVLALEGFCKVTCLDDSNSYPISYIDSFDYIIRYGWRVEDNTGFDNGDFCWNISSTSAKNILVVCFDCRMLAIARIEEIDSNFDTIIFDSSFSQQNGFNFFAHKVTEVVSPAILDYPSPVSPRSNSEVFRFLHISNSLHYIKGIDIIADAFVKAFDPSDRSVVLKILATEKQNGLEGIKRMFDNQDRSHQLIIDQNRYPHSEIWDLYSDTDCYVCASRSETFSLPTVEAASVGVPIIMHNNGGMRDYSPMCLHYTPRCEHEVIASDTWRRNAPVTTLRPNIQSLAGKMIQARSERRVNGNDSMQALVLRYSINIIEQTLKTVLCVRN